jgi:hypothetical protein
MYYFEAGLWTSAGRRTDKARQLVLTSIIGSVIRRKLILLSSKHTWGDHMACIKAAKIDEESFSASSL